MLATACATLLCVVFGTAAFSKLTSAGFREFVSTAGLLALVPARVRTMVGVATVTAEIAVTVATAAFVFTRRPELGILGFVCAAGLLGVFTVAIGIALARGDRRPCRCFGAAAAPLGPAHVVRNCLLAAAAVTGVVGVATATPAEPLGALVAGFAASCVAVLILRLDDILALAGPVSKG